MRLVQNEEDATTGAPFRLHHLTDIHAGASDFAEDELRERVALIEQDDFARWTMGGDGGELIRHNDPRYTPSSMSLRYRQATDIRLATIEHLCELLEPIKDKCWGWADGNHEAAMDKHYGGHFGVEVLANLGLLSKYLDYRGFVNVTFRLTETAKVRQVIDIQHGWQCGRLRGGPSVQAERELGMTEAHIVLRGHNHQPDHWSFVTLGVSRDATKVIRKTRSVVNGGCWKVGYRDNLAQITDGHLSEVEKAVWGETKGYRPEHIGGPVLRLDFDHGESRNRSWYIGPGRPCQVLHSVVWPNVNERTLGLVA